MRNHSNKNEFDLHENGRAGDTHFHMNGFAHRLVLTKTKGNSKMAYLDEAEQNIAIIYRFAEVER